MNDLNGIKMGCSTNGMKSNDDAMPMSEIVSADQFVIDGNECGNLDEETPIDASTCDDPVISNALPPSHPYVNVNNSTHTDDASLPNATKKGIAHVSERIANRDRLPESCLLHSRYKIKNVIGTGGFGIVYLAVDLDTGSDVAVKTLRHSIAEFNLAAKRFLREIQLCKSIDNPHVVKIFDHGILSENHTERLDIDDDHIDDTDTPYYVMELLKGKTIEDYLQQRTKFTFAEVRNIMIDALDGLAAVHDKNIVHRDMKPANINVDVSEDIAENKIYDVKVLDFGIAKVVGEDSMQKITQTGAWMGSPVYMSPEQLKGTELSPCTDIYAIGLIMLEMLTGFQTIEGDSPMDIAVKILSPEPIPIDAWVEESTFGPIIRKCIDKNPLNRYQNASELKKVLIDLDVNRLKGEYSALKIANKIGSRVRSNTTLGLNRTQADDALPSSAQLSQQIKASTQKNIINLLLIIGIVLAFLTLGIIIFIKAYVDKSINIKALPTEQKTMIASAIQGAAMGILSPVRQHITISGMPHGATIYAMPEHQKIGQIPLSIDVYTLWAASCSYENPDITRSPADWNLQVEAEGYENYPFVISRGTSASVNLTMERIRPNFQRDQNGNLLLPEEWLKSGKITIPSTTEMNSQIVGETMPDQIKETTQETKPIQPSDESTKTPSDSATTKTPAKNTNDKKTEKKTKSTSNASKKNNKKTEKTNTTQSWKIDDLL